MGIDDELEGYTGSTFCKSCQHLYETFQAAMLESSCNTSLVHTCVHCARDWRCGERQQAGLYATAGLQCFWGVVGGGVCPPECSCRGPWCWHAEQSRFSAACLDGL